MSDERTFYRPDIQGVRGLAIILVVLAHAHTPGFPGGFVGVDVFFVLSGYLISRILFQEYVSTGNIQFLRFIARRLRRLLPALLAMLLCVMMLGTLLLSTHEYNVQTASVSFAATWTSNLYFSFTNFDYFNELYLRDLFLHTWSLGVEEQFYLFWPWALLALLYVSDKRSASELTSASVLLGLTALFLLSLALSVYWTKNSGTLAFYLMPARIWQFALGAMVFLWFEKRPRLLDRLPPLGSSDASRLMGLLLILGSAALFDPMMPYPGLWALLPSFGAALLIAPNGQNNDSYIGKLLTHPISVWIGDRSYSWYLWHWPLLMFGFAWGLESVAISVAAIVALSMMLAAASYRWIELPIWKGGFSHIHTKTTFSAAIPSILVAAVMLGLINDSDRDGAASGSALVQSVRNDMPAPYGISGCDTWFRDAELQPCVFGKSDSARVAVLFGDSIGTQWFSFLPEILPADNWQIVVLTKSSCAIVDETYHYGPVGEYTVCSDWRSRALEYIIELEPEIVFIGNAATYGFSETQWRQGTGRVLEKLGSSVEHVVLIPGTPSLSFDGPGCLERWWADSPPDRIPSAEACREPVKNGHADRVSGYLRDVVNAHDNANILNLNDLVCPGGYCAAREPSGVVVFRDQQHLTDSFVRSKVPIIKERLAQIGVINPKPH